jgi:hypothetical protein
MTGDDTSHTAGEMMRAKELSPKDIEGLFSGKTALPLSNGYALVLPAWKGLTLHVQEVIRSTLLQAKVVKTD